MQRMRSSGAAGRCAFRQQKAFITLCSPVVPLLSTSKADSGLASEFRRDRAIYTAYERMLKEGGASQTHQCMRSNMQLAHEQLIQADARTAACFYARMSIDE